MTIFRSIQAGIRPSSGMLQHPIGPGFTMDTCTHLLDSAQAEAAERLAEMLGNGASKSECLPAPVQSFDRKELVPSERG